MSLRSGILTAFACLVLAACSTPVEKPNLDHQKLAAEYFAEDSAWLADNIPFFECSDKEIEQVYYYRWKLYKAHIRNTGPNEYIITEFIDHVAWDREPFCTINAASMHHIYEGRWLRDPRYMDGYINNLYQQGGNDRRYSESVADAAYARYLVDGDQDFIVAQLDKMKSTYEGWYDHYDSTKKMFWIPAMPDATEYTIASIDGSGGTAGFDGGETFRPTINSYMYGNALAISKIAALKGDEQTRHTYAQRANELKSLVEKNLWNDSLQHFTDRYKMDNSFVKYWTFIRGRELAGMAPWYFNLPADNDKYTLAWQHVLDTTQLLGKYGFRTNEPSYEYYFKQFIWFEGKRGSQWNGPSWPYQSSQALTSMANVLNNYHQQVVSNSDYLHVLRLFTRQHYLPDGKINLVENYDPNLGGPIVYYYWSNHYLHSTYNNLVISGLCGVRPSEGDSLTINPLVDHSIQYFYLDNINYRGHDVSVVYDQDGSRYNIGKGLTVFVDGEKADAKTNGTRTMVYIGKTLEHKPDAQPINVALNLRKKDSPVPAASVNNVPDSLYQAIDGRIWYFPEIRNRWATTGSTSTTDWYTIKFGSNKKVSEIKLYLFADHKRFDVPDAVTIEYKTDNEWKRVERTEDRPLTGNTSNTIRFKPVLTDAIRVIFEHKQKQVALTELECY